MKSSSEYLAICANFRPLSSIAVMLACAYLQGREQEITLSDLVHVAGEEQKAWFQRKESYQVRASAYNFSLECKLCMVCKGVRLRHLRTVSLHASTTMPLPSSLQYCKSRGNCTQPQLKYYSVHAQQLSQHLYSTLSVFTMMMFTCRSRLLVLFWIRSICLTNAIDMCMPATAGLP